jgi:hypothetical protein
MSRSVPLEALPRALRAKARSMKPEAREALATICASKPAAIRAAFGDVAMVEVAADLAERRIADAHAAFMRVKDRVNVTEAEVAQARLAYEETAAAAMTARATAVAAVRDKAAGVVLKAARAAQNLDEPRRARLAETLRASLTQGPAATQAALEAMLVEPAQHRELAAAIDLVAAETSPSSHEARGLGYLHAVRGELVPAEVKEAGALVAQLDSIKPELIDG